MIQKTTLVITSKEQKQKWLKRLFQKKKITPMKFMTEETLFSKLTFTWDYQALLYLAITYQLKIENAFVYLEAMRYVEDKTYNCEKLDQLVALKQELTKQNLLHYDHLFMEKLKQYQVIFELNEPSKFLTKLIDRVAIQTEVTIHEAQPTSEFTHPVYQFSDMEAEVTFVADRISELLIQGIPISNIKLVNAHTEYEALLRRIFSFYHIPLALPSKIALSATPIGAEFLAQCETLPVDALLLHLQEQYPQEQGLLEQIATCINQLGYRTKLSAIEKDYLTFLMHQTYVKEDTLKDAVTLSSLEALEKEDYAFLIGCNTDTVPRIKKDESYLSDSLQSILGYDCSYEINDQVKQKTMRLIKQHPHLTITYKELGVTGACYPSSLLAELPLEKLDSEAFQSTIHYAPLLDQLQFAQSLDDYFKYGTRNRHLASLLKTYPAFPYRAYQHAFTGIKPSLIQTYLQPELVLSYTNLDKYMRCHFRYYLDCILKLNDYEETFQTMIGNYFHALLEHMREDDFDFDQYTASFFAGKDLSYKERFFLIRLQKEAQSVLAIVKQQEELSNFKKLYLEKKIKITLPGAIPVVFKGFIDKIMEGEVDGKTYVSLIDYKTGQASISLDQTIHGLALQLPVYVYLIHHAPEFSQASVSGIYLQHILNNEKLKDDRKEKKDIQRNDLKLNGYTIDQESVIQAFDKTYRESELIKSMKVTEKGFGPYSKVLSASQFERLDQLVDQKIQETITGILIEADFRINPKSLKEEIVSCKYCPYQDICYRSYQDVIYLQEQKYQEFLGGETWDEVGQPNN